MLLALAPCAFAQVDEDLRVLAEYTRTSPIGAFFDDASSNGLFSRIAGHYPDYRAYIEPYGVRTSDGRVLYPTAETRAFLERLASAQQRVTPVVVPEAPAVIDSGVPQSAPPLQNVATPTCAQPVRIESLELSSKGLVVRGSGPLAAKIANVETVGEAGFATFTNVTVEIPFADLGTAPNRATSEEGPFSGLRAVRYQTPTDCGVRIRLEARAPALWRVVPSADALVIAAEEQPRPAVLALEKEREARNGRGTIRVSGTYFGAKTRQIATSESGEGQVSFATDIPGVGTLRGFAAQGIPLSVTGGRFAGMALSGFYVGRLQTELAGGDISIPLGAEQASSINSLTIRGGAVSLFPTSSVHFSFFGGRAATPTLRRVFDTRESVGISEDHVFGGAAERRSRSNEVGMSAAWIRSVPHGGAYTNLLESLQTPPAAQYGVRLIAEQSFVDSAGVRQNGTAWTIEPRAATPHVALGGFYRYTSPLFHAPLSSSFFATLRHMYTVFGTYRPNDRWSASASLSRAKTFSLFDEPTLGTLSSSQSVSASYRLLRNVGMSASRAESRAESDPGVLVGANSRTTSNGAGIFVTRPKWTYGLHFSDNRTKDFTGSGGDFASRRVDADGTWSATDFLQWFGRAYYGDARRPNGISAGGDRGLSLGVHSNSHRFGTLRGEAGYSKTPMGLTIEPTSQLFATIGYTPPASLHAIDGNVQLTFQSIRVDDRPTRNVVSLALNLGRLLEWGSDPRPVAPYETRALSVGEPPASVPAAQLRVIAFEDVNRNGAYDPSEPLVPHVQVQVDALHFMTSDTGEAIAMLPAGSHIVTIGGSIASNGFVFMRPSDFGSVLLRPAQRRDVLVPLVPAGRILGTLRFEGAVPDPALLEGIRITATGPVTREVVTSDAEFQFGLLPAGTYTVAIDPRTIAAETRLTGASSMEVVVDRNSRVLVTFGLRLATARERVTAPAPQPPM